MSEALRRPEADEPRRADDLVRPFLRPPVTEVALSTLTRPFGSETLSASSAVAARADEIQLDLGDGPMWKAFHSRTPVLQADLRQTPDEWPAVTAALLEHGVAAAFVFPLWLGALSIGCVSLYCPTPTVLPSARVAEASAMTKVTARRVLAVALHRAATEQPGEWNAGEYPRREIHQAAGMVAAQTGTTPDDALLLLRATAFAAGRSLLELSADVLNRVIDFTDPGNPETQRGTSHE